MTQRSIYALQTEAQTQITMSTDGEGQVFFEEIPEATDGAERAWVVRLHLEPGQRAKFVTLDGRRAERGGRRGTPGAAFACRDNTSPLSLRGTGSRPPVNAGYIAALRLASGAHARTLSVSIA